MENSVYQKQQKKSKAIVALRVALGVALLLAGIGAIAFQSARLEASRVVISDNMPISGLERGTPVRLESSMFLLVGWVGQNEKKPEAHIYFVPVYDGDGEIEEIYVLNSKKNYEADEALDDRPIRVFKGTVNPNENWGQHTEWLLDYSDFDIDRARELLARDYITASGGSDLGVGVLLLILGGILMAVNLAAWFATGKLKKRMAAYGVDEMAVDRFEREYQRGFEAYGKVELTESWLFNRTAGATCLLPLKEVVWLYEKRTRHYTNGIPTGTTYTVELFFSDGGTLSVAGRKNSVDSILAGFAARCPQALLGFTEERKQTWAKDKQQIVRASREKAAALWRETQAAPAQEEAAQEGTAAEASDNQEEKA